MQTQPWMIGTAGLALAAGTLWLTAGRTTAATPAPDAAESAQTPASQDTDGEWVALFDGTNTDHWRGYRQDAFPESGWEVVDGTLHKIAGAGGGDIITVEQYDSFELRWEWKVAQGANSGVFYHVAEGDDLGAVYFTGPEYQILDDDRHRDGQNPTTSAAALYALIECNDAKALSPVGEWNSSRLLVDGNHVEHWLNGEKVVEYELESDALLALIAGSKFRDWPRFAREGRGHIALQDHGDDVWFRDIRVREIE